MVAGRDSYAFLPDTPRDEAVGYWLGNDAIARVAEIDGRVVGMQLTDNRLGLGAARGPARPSWCIRQRRAAASAARWARIVFARPAIRATKRCSSTSS